MSKLDNDNEFDSKYTPLISIVVPIYNVAGYVEKCIKSIVEQSYSNLEIILVNDGSTDGSSIICDKYASKDSRIRVIHKENGGLVSARKAGVTVVQGEYVIYVDGDDWIEKDRVYNAVKEIQNEPVDMLYMSGHYKEYSNSSKRIFEKFEELRSYYGKQVEEEFFLLIQDPTKCFERKIKLAVWMWMIKKELLAEKIKLIDNRINLAEDELCIWFCLLSASSVKVCREEGYHYIQRSNSLTGEKSKMERKSVCLFSKLLFDYIKNYDFISYMQNIFNTYYIMTMLAVDYKILFEMHNDYLYPYSKVKRGSKIILYGAGRMGREMFSVLKSSEEYDLILWVDQSIDRPEVNGYRVQSVEKIKDTEYDYIVVGVLYERDAMEIKCNLMKKGVPEDKIACMNIKEINHFVVDKIKEKIDY